jgi:hypothetical protein
VVPALFGKWRKMTACRGDSSFSHPTLSLVAVVLRGPAPSLDLLGIRIFNAIAIHACGDELFLVGIVTKLSRFFPSPRHGSGNPHTQAVIVPSLPIFTFRMNNIETLPFQSNHSLAPMRQTSDVLEAMMSRPPYFCTKS